MSAHVAGHRGLCLLAGPRGPHHPAAMATTTSLGAGPRPSLPADVQGGLQVAAAACTACGSSAGSPSVRQPPSFPFGLGRHMGSTAGGLSSSLPPTVRPWGRSPQTITPSEPGLCCAGSVGQVSSPPRLALPQSGQWPHPCSALGTSQAGRDRVWPWRNACRALGPTLPREQSIGLLPGVHTLSLPGLG